MKFSCEKALLLGAVSTASRAVAVKSSIPSDSLGMASFR